MTSQSTIDYLQARATATDVLQTGEILTTVTVTFDNGVTATGSAIRDINSFDQAEAQKAAYEQAFESLLPGVEFVLTKQG